MNTKITHLKAEVTEVLTTNILPYWINKMVDTTYGGFYGRIDGTEVCRPEAEKGAILHARMLWTFSAAYRLLKKRRIFRHGHTRQTVYDRLFL